MKKGWIMTLVLVSVVCVFQQSMVYSASCNSSCPDNKRDEGRAKLYYPNPDRFNNYLLCTGGNWEDWCCACYEDNEPYICDSTLTCPDPGLSLSPTNTPTPSNTPFPTNTPTPVPVDCRWSSWSSCYNAANCGTGTRTRYPSPPASNGGAPCTGYPSESCTLNPCPVNCEWNEYGPCSKECGEGTKTRTIKTPAAYGGTSCTGSSTTTCINRLCSDIGTGGVIIVASTNQESLSVSANSRPTPTRGPTPTPEQARFNTIDYYLQAFRQPTPTRAPIPTVAPTAYLFSPVIVPTIVPILPTPTLRPESIIPGSLAAQSHTVGRTSFTLNTGSISEIRIDPNPLIKTAPIREKAFLPQEQKLLAQNVGMTGGGIMVTLQQKTGSQFVTRQDELTVKRGNQFFSISNQAAASDTKSVQKIQEKTNSTTDTAQEQPIAKLEINANNVVAQSSMALSVDPLSGILIVETPNGPQKVSIMPDEALGIIIELKALNTGIPDPSILLVSENGKLIYRISGAKMEKFIGLLPIAIQKQVLVSADTGSIIKVELSLISSILSFFTF